MLLVKCPCGHFYTMSESNATRSAKFGPRTCPNCGEKHNFSENLQIRAMSVQGLEVYRIPDDAKLSIEVNPLKQTSDLHRK